jgi:hypothetical protein
MRLVSPTRHDATAAGCARAVTPSTASTTPDHRRWRFGGAGEPLRQLVPKTSVGGGDNGVPRSAELTHTPMTTVVRQGAARHRALRVSAARQGSYLHVVGEPALIAGVASTLYGRHTTSPSSFPRAHPAIPASTSHDTKWACNATYAVSRYPARKRCRGTACPAAALHRAAGERPG